MIFEDWHKNKDTSLHFSAIQAKVCSESRFTKRQITRSEHVWPSISLNFQSFFNRKKLASGKGPLGIQKY